MFRWRNRCDLWHFRQVRVHVILAEESALQAEKVIATLAAHHYVYIALCSDNTLYTGYTTNIVRRIATHNAGKGARYTRARLPVSLVASWECVTKSEALRLEYALKRFPRAQKMRLIATPALIGQHVSIQILPVGSEKDENSIPS